MSVDAAIKDVQKRERLRIEQMQWLPIWRQCTAFCCPGKQRTVDNVMADLSLSTRARFNPIRQSSTAIDSLNVLSGGCKSWLIPGGDEGWGGMWQPDPSQNQGEDVKDWYADCTARSLLPLQRGGFFTAGHEMLQDLGVFGTEGFLIEEGDEANEIYCQAIMPTNFVFERDWKDEVICVQITWSKEASWIVDKFTEPGDTVPERVRDNLPSNGNIVHELLQTIYRRTDDEVKEDRPNEPAGQRYGSRWVHCDSKTVMRERGYPELPFVAPRWMTWAGTGPSNYGTSPAMQALADCKGLNVFDMVMAVRAELEVNPRIKVMPGQTGSIGLSPGDVTQMNEREGVQEWAVPGSYAIGKDQTDVIERRIKRAFFTDLFEAVTPIAQQRELNIPVADAIQREAATRITPAMGRIEQDFFQVALNRVFWVLFRANVFEQPPEGALTYDRTGKAYLLPPRVVQANRMSRTLNARKSFAFSQAMGRAQLMVGMGRPDVLDFYDFETISRDLDRGDAMPDEWRFTDEQVAKMRAERAEIQQQQAGQQALTDAFVKDPVGIANLAGVGPQAA